MDLYKITKAFAALSQETRLEILQLLVKADDRGLSAGDIADTLGVPQNTLSFHLNHMEAADLVHRRRQGRFIIYSYNDEGMKDLLTFLVTKCVRK